MGSGGYIVTRELAHESFPPEPVPHQEGIGVELAGDRVITRSALLSPVDTLYPQYMQVKCSCG